MIEIAVNRFEDKIQTTLDFEGLEFDLHLTIDHYMMQKEFDVTEVNEFLVQFIALLEVFRSKQESE